MDSQFYEFFPVKSANFLLLPTSAEAAVTFRIPDIRIEPLSAGRFFIIFYFSFMPKTIGILGGLGPQTTSHFYLDLIRAATHESRPPVCIWSLPLNIRKEAEFIASGKHRDHFFQLMHDGALRLARAGSQFIVIPCNTVHEFHPILAGLLDIPVVNLIEIVAQEVVKRGWGKIFLLATSRTIQTKLYQHALEKKSIEICLPDSEDQQKLDFLIQGLLGERMSQKHQKFVASLIEQSGAEHIILGCTDLQLVFTPSENVIDSMQTLVLHTAGLI